MATCFLSTLLSSNLMLKITIQGINYQIYLDEKVMGRSIPFD